MREKTGFEASDTFHVQLAYGDLREPEFFLDVEGPVEAAQLADFFLEVLRLVHHFRGGLLDEVFEFAFGSRIFFCFLHYIFSGLLVACGVWGKSGRLWEIVDLEGNLFFDGVSPLCEKEDGGKCRDPSPGLQCQNMQRLFWSKREPFDGEERYDRYLRSHE